LGYGGTKEEMQRLLEDAEKISGIKYDISSFADVTQAIHVIQTELGITGTTALEASSTIQGSASAMKASWQNLLTGMADPTQNFEQLLKNFISSVGTFLGNLLPVFTTATQGVLQMVQGLLPQIPVLIEQMLPIVI
jgi:phage-related protein